MTTVYADIPETGLDLTYSHGKSVTFVTTVYADIPETGLSLTYSHGTNVTFVRWCAREVMCGKGWWICR